jgi:hypothetical protein
MVLASFVHLARILLAIRTAPSASETSEMDSYILTCRNDRSYGMRTKYFLRLVAAMAIVMLAFALDAYAESCQTSTEMDAATKNALRAAAQQYYGFVAAANAQAIATNSIPEIANNQPALAELLKQNSADLANSTATPRNVFILDASDSTAGTVPNAQFFCGVFNPSSDNKIGFTLQNLPAGKYGLVIMDVTGSRNPYFYSFLLKQDPTGWKVAALFPRPRMIAGHDAQWYWQQARDYKAKGQNHNAWFHYLVARELAAPLPFMGTTKLDTFNDEVTAAQPPDLPEQNPVTISSPAGRTFTMTSLFVVPDEKTNALDLVMKYENPDIADSAKAFSDNREAMIALLAKYPEFRVPFTNLVARGVAPTGQDFGTMLPMKDIK